MTLVELKMKKAELRNRMDEEKPYILLETADEYNDVIFALQQAEKKLLKPIVISMLIAVILSIGGCAKMLEGSGRIIEGLGDGVIAGGIHLQDSSSSKGK